MALRHPVMLNGNGGFDSNTKVMIFEHGLDHARYRRQGDWVDASAVELEGRAVPHEPPGCCYWDGDEAILSQARGLEGSRLTFQRALWEPPAGLERDKPTSFAALRTHYSPPSASKRESTRLLPALLLPGLGRGASQRNQIRLLEHSELHIDSRPICRRFGGQRWSHAGRSTGPLLPSISRIRMPGQTLG